MTTAKILLIDDDAELLDMLKTYLEREGFSVTTTNVAANGVAAALSADYGLVVLDVMMPHMSGIEALRRIRMTSLIPVLMLTAKGDDADCIVGLELGADDYVPNLARHGNWLRASAQFCVAPVPPRKSKKRRR